MKEKFWGLKKDEVDRFIRRKDREFQFELQKIEFELITTKKENENLIEQLTMEEKKQIALSINDPYWQLASSRIKSVLSMLTSQKESEMTLLKEASNEKIEKFQREIIQLDEEIKSINEVIGKLVYQLNNEPVQSSAFINEETEVIKIMSNQDDSEEYLDIAIQTPSDLVVHQQDTSAALLEETDPLIDHHHEASSSPFLMQETKQEFLEEEILSPKNRLVEQISSFKEQYIIGKIAGEDLFDHNGKLIISKNSKISKDVVELANTNAKLAELIVNMKVFRTGEELDETNNCTD
jgi:hypothetical protein